MRKLSFNNTAAGVAVIGMAAFGAAPVGAMPIDNDFGWDITWNTTLSVGSTWRAQDRDMSLVKAADGASVGLTGGSGGSSSDANNLNYDKGDRVSTIFKLVTDLEVKRDEMGGLIRLKAWHDQALDNRGAPYGNQANGYTKGAALSDDGFSDAQKFEGLQLLDAYAYNSFDVADRPLQVRLGRQVINWGESLFFQGVNQINPLDVPALRRPGAEIKEGLTPVWAAQANLGLGGGASVEGFYQLKWEATEADACGTYWSTVDIGVGADPGRCNKIVVGSSASATANASNRNAPVTQGREAKDSGEKTKDKTPKDPEQFLYDYTLCSLCGTCMENCPAGALRFSKNVYMVSLSSYYTFYLIHKFGVSVRDAQVLLFLFLGAVAVGTVAGGPVGDRYGRKGVIWFSILGVLPFTLALPYVGLLWTAVLSVVIGLILASAFSAIVVFAQELVPGRVGMVAGLFFGLAFGVAGIGAAVLLEVAPAKGIDSVYHLWSFLPLVGLLAVLLPRMGRPSPAGGLG